MDSGTADAQREGAVTEAAFSLSKAPPRVKKGTHVFDYAKAQISFEEGTN